MKPSNSMISGTFVDDTQNFSFKEADVAMLGVSFDLSTTYSQGAWFGPFAIIDASYQVNFEAPYFKHKLTGKIIIHSIGVLEYKKNSKNEKEALKESEIMVKDVKRESLLALNENKFLMTFGGDHSIANGIFQAMKEKFESKKVTIIHFDGHTDLWQAFHGNKYSHASIMSNAKELGFPSIHIGIRDHLGEDAELFAKHNLLINTFFCATMPKKFYEMFKISSKNLIFDSQISDAMIKKICSQIKTKYAYISFDIDVLDSSIIQGTGTPLPLGLSVGALEKILFEIILFCKKNNIVLLGFDLVEVSPQLKIQADYYDAKNCISTSTEMTAALIAYKILFWQYLERFK